MGIKIRDAEIHESPGIIYRLRCGCYFAVEDRTRRNRPREVFFQRLACRHPHKLVLAIAPKLLEEDTQQDWTR